MARLTDFDRSFLKVFLRSDDVGEGWRNVSKPIWQWVEKFSSPELLEKQPAENGGRVRLSEKGQEVLEYIL